MMVLIQKGETADCQRLPAARFGEWLVRENIVTQSRVTDALKHQLSIGKRLGETLVHLEMMTDEQMANALAQFLEIERFLFTSMSSIDIDTARLIPEYLAKRYDLIGVVRENDTLVVAMSDPLDLIAKDTIASRLNTKVIPKICSSREIRQAIEMVYHGSDVAERHIKDLIDVVISTEEAEFGTENEDAINDLEEANQVDANTAPVVRFVDLLLSQAIKSRASDIHIEPQEKTMCIRMRVDGMLREMTAPPRRMQAAVIARFKILASMNIAERRLPQDGRFRVKAPERDIDLRVSAIPSIYGEKVVIRILDKAAVNHNLDKLGFDPDHLSLLKESLSQPHGIIIVTGPTGSGKSTTLYSALNYLRDPRKNITTVEDPVEYRLHGINQIQVKSEIGLNFAKCLRSILRQDPDIVLIGEIRDRETMEIAIQASLTGHLVLSTFHTNDAPSALSRLAYMGLERYLLASTLNLVIAQRLVRRVCPYCKEPITLHEDVLLRFNGHLKGRELKVFRGRGCASCENTGYMGRLPIFEFLPLDRQMRELVTQGSTEAQIRDMARRKGFDGLLKSGLRRMIEGETTPEEVMRVTYIEKAFDAPDDPAKA